METEGVERRDLGATTRASADSRDVLRHCDFRDFLRFLGIDQTDASGLVMIAAQQMFSSSLPPDWSEHVDEGSSRIYFFNQLTGESAWSHPQEALFRELVEEIKCWRTEDPLEAVFARSDAHLRRQHARAAETMAQWSGPYDAPQGPEEAPECGESAQPPQYYFNATTGESRWADPRLRVEFDLKQCHGILSECIAGHTETLAKMAASDSEEDGDDDRRPPRVQAFVQNLWESLGTLPLPSRHIDAPCHNPPPETMNRPSTLPAGDDTVRSTMSYLTARSEVSSTPRADMATHANLS